MFKITMLIYLAVYITNPIKIVNNQELMAINSVFNANYITGYRATAYPVEDSLPPTSILKNLDGLSLGKSLIDISA